MSEHVPGVFATLSSVCPFLTARMTIAAIFAEMTGFGTIGDHPSAVVVTGATRGVATATRILVLTIHPVTTPSATSSATSGITTTTTGLTTAITAGASLPAAVEAGDLMNPIE